MNTREFFGKLNDGFFRKAALREARARMVPSSDGRGRALAQAKLLLEVARRTAEPVEALPTAGRPAALLGLYRDAVYWALVAARAGAEEPPSDLRTLWAEAPVESLPPIAREAGRRAALEGPLLASPTGPGALDATAEDASRVRELAEGLVAELDGPRQRADRILAERWSRFAVAALAVVLVVVGLRLAMRGPNLLENKPFRTSSSWSGCAADPPCTALLFHTEHQNSPWVEFDLGAPKRFHRIEVANRTDCCSDRAVPLIAEVSSDRTNWTEVGRRDTEFSSWTAKFKPVTARYVRLRVPRETALHLREVAVR